MNQQDLTDILERSIQHQENIDSFQEPVEHIER